MNYLLDTHIFIWWSEDPKPKFKSIISNPKNRIYVSIVSLWEMAIKISIKKLRLKTSIDNLSKQYGFETLPVKMDHLITLLKLPHLHKDPFDRMLDAQAKTEKLRLLTSDPKVLAYL
ncbi:type II toxin-antitoxin system VapC family toxin [Candidatus Amesbacteria bacterium]|nr:type II toxin-antitoxin system VapC family toxin [Candidatus Amesbacteria bacterium]